MTGGDLMGALSEGPARLSAGEVAASQRRRMLAAMVAAAAEKGYVAVAVADVVRRARVSRATFYEQFTDKTDCFLAAFQACADQLVTSLGEIPLDGLPPRRRVRALIDTYLQGLAAFPEGARVCLVEMYAVGPQAAAERRRIQREFATLFRQMHTSMAEAGEPVRPATDFEFEALVGAIGALATNRVAMGEAAELPALAGPLERFVLGHFGLDVDGEA